MVEDKKSPIDEKDLNQVEKLALEKIRAIKWVKNPYEKDNNIEGHVYYAEVSEDVRDFIKGLMEWGKVEAHTITANHVPVTRRDLTDFFGVNFETKREI